jgi:hypothetical protein
MKIARFFKHHIDPRFFLTPFAITAWDIQAREIKMSYIFGIRIARVHVN